MTDKDQLILENLRLLWDRKIAPESALDFIRNVLSAPTQDGTAEEVIQELLDIEYPDDPQYANLESALISRKYCIQAMTNYAAPLRAEIERLKKDLDAQIYAKEHFRIQSVDMQLEMYNTFVSLKHKEDELAAANQQIAGLVQTIESHREQRELDRICYENRLAASVSPKLVMPSKDTNNEMFSNRAYYKDGFNACLSELRRLNPSLFK